MYGTSGFAEKLNIQNNVNTTENYVHYSFAPSGFVEKLNTQNCVISTGNYVQHCNVWFCGEIEYLKFSSFSGNLCTLYIYEMSGFAETLNI